MEKTGHNPVGTRHLPKTLNNTKEGGITRQSTPEAHLAQSSSDDYQLHER